MQTVDELNKSIISLQHSYDVAVKNNAQIRQKIEDLRSALRYVDAAKGSAKTARNNLKKTPVPDRWKGKWATQTKNKCAGELKTDLDTYYKDIKELRSNIRNQIIALELQINRLVDLCQSITKKIDKAHDDIRALTAKA